MRDKQVALLIAGFIISGLIYTHPAYAHNFGGDQSAGWLAKVAEIKTEINLVAKNVGKSKALDYYADALGEYWNSNDTKEMGEKNTLLQKEIPAIINATISDAKSGNQTAVNSDASLLDGYLDESVQVRIDKDKLNNSTVQALAVTFVIKEALEKYGNALNSTVDLNDMSQMNMNNTSGMRGNNMSGMSGSNMSSGSMSGSAIVDQSAYENSVGLANTAQQMFSDLALKNTDKSASNDKISSSFTKLLQDLNNKANVNTIMSDVHVGIHPTLISTYNIQLTQTVPEFPMPILLVVLSISGIVVATRLKPRLGF